MLELDDIKYGLKDLEKRLHELGESLDITAKKQELQELEEQTKANEFWNDQENSSKVLQSIKVLKDKINRFEEQAKLLEDIHAMIELIEELNEESMIEELKLEVKKFSRGIEKLEIQSLLSGKHDANNAIVTIHPGAGGTESQDWAEMLYRMYSMWCDKNGYKLEELDYLEGDVAGLKSVTFSVTGNLAYGYLKSESGVHRLVRISPFDAGGRRHTSFASVEVIPEIDEDLEVEIDPKDLKVDTYRSSGAGGQHINKTESAIRITHIPTNIVVSCQTQRSQIQNRETAMKMLISKLEELKERENKATISELKGVQREIAWGSQIRSYVFCPYTMVKDHRTNFETGNVDAVMNGELNDFMDAYLKMNMKQ
ncbi:MAG: peptide chain release factor 2 [Clostridia bacterium]|nr:peptide chain release factor 2 [Clostridia bacterium]